MLDEWIRKSEGKEENNEVFPWKGKTKILLVLLVSVGLLALLWPSSTGKNEQLSTGNQVVRLSNADVKTIMMNELQAILSQVKGAGTVDVSITLASEGEKSYARNTRDEERNTRETDTSGGERDIKEVNVFSDVAVSSGQALLIEDRAPEVVGVLVVAEGAEDARVKEKLTDITVTLLNLYPHQVRVVAREGGNS
ncbi:MAG: hypothetical protein U9N81_03000 [Bacillota bacterium]|nr:hypothetical protein [Bacillota bacterium]